MTNTTDRPLSEVLAEIRNLPRWGKIEGSPSDDEYDVPAYILDALLAVVEAAEHVHKQLPGVKDLADALAALRRL